MIFGRGRKIHHRRFMILLLLFYIVFLSHPMIIVDVAAPPIGAACFPGLITGTNQDLVITDAEVNMTAFLIPSPSGYRCNISLETTLNLTNPYNSDTDLYLLYNPSWASSSGNVSESSPEWSLDGDYVRMSNSTFYNLTHPRQLPIEFHDRFPSWVWVHEEIWYRMNNLTLINITLGPGVSRLLSFEDSFKVDTYLVDYFEAGFGFSAGQIQSDKTVISMRIEMLQSAYFYHVLFYPDDTVSVTQIGENYIGNWVLEYPFSPKLLYGNSPEPIRGGCSGYILIHQVNYPPTVDYTTPTTSNTQETPISIPTSIVQVIGATLVSASIITALVVLNHYRKRN